MAGQSGYNAGNRENGATSVGNGGDSQWLADDEKETITQRTALTYADEVVNNSLKQLENDLAEYITAAIAALRIRGGMGGMTNETWAKITDPSTLKTWVAIASNCKPAFVFSLQRIAAAGGLSVVVSALMAWLPHRGDSTMSRGGGHEKEMKSLTCSFDSFIHRIPDYRNTSVELTELLECLVEAVVAEMLASVLVHVEVGKNEVPMDVIDAIAVYAVNALMRTEGKRFRGEVAESLFLHVSNRWAVVISASHPWPFQSMPGVSRKGTTRCGRLTPSRRLVRVALLGYAHVLLRPHRSRARIVSPRCDANSGTLLQRVQGSPQEEEQDTHA